MIERRNCWKFHGWVRKTTDLLMYDVDARSTAVRDHKGHDGRLDVRLEYTTVSTKNERNILLRSYKVYAVVVSVLIIRRGANLPYMTHPPVTICTRVCIFIIMGGVLWSVESYRLSRLWTSIMSTIPTRGHSDDDNNREKYYDDHGKVITSYMSLDEKLHVHMVNFYTKMW